MTTAARLLSLVPITLVALILTACDWTTQADSSLPAYRHQVAVVPVSFQPGYAIKREFAGEVVAPQSPNVAFELAGQLREILADEGDTVTAGQVLARLDLQLLEAEAAELDARSEEIRADLDLARRNLARIERLESEQLASAREKDEFASQVRSLEASLRRNAAALDANRIRREKSVLTAPFDARVGLRLEDEGAVVAAGSPVFQLTQLERREIRAGVPQAVASTLTTGTRVTLRSGAASAEGTVVAIGVAVDPGTRSQVIRVAVDEDWAPGELAYVALDELVPQPGAWLPDTAVTGGLRGTWLVYVALPNSDREAVLETRTVTIEHADGNRLFVSGALAEGEMVVAAGLHRVAPGQAVRTEPGEVPAAETGAWLGHVRPRS